MEGPDTLPPEIGRALTGSPELQESGLWETVVGFIDAHPAITTAAFAASVAMFVGGILLVPWLVVRIPADFFLRHDKPRSYRHPIIHALGVATRNVIGWPLLVLGVAMLVLPGQGLLTILVAVALIDFPGKRRVELALVREKHLHRAIDWLRQRAGVAPLVIPDK